MTLIRVSCRLSSKFGSSEMVSREETTGYIRIVLDQINRPINPPSVLPSSSGGGPSQNGMSSPVISVCLWETKDRSAWPVRGRS